MARSFLRSKSEASEGSLQNIPPPPSAQALAVRGEQIAVAGAEPYLTSWSFAGAQVRAPPSNPSRRKKRNPSNLLVPLQAPEPLLPPPKPAPDATERVRAGLRLCARRLLAGISPLPQHRDPTSGLGAPSASPLVTTRPAPQRIASQLSFTLPRPFSSSLTFP
jgi:hypothetical protein